jgi:hypothetical protein
MARPHIIRTVPPPPFQNTGIAQIFGLLFGRRLLSVIAMLAALGVASSSASVQQARGNAAAPTGGHACPHDDGGMKLPAGFYATVFADGIGHARHLVVAPNGKG